jgi:hypothetical protein
MARTLWEEFAAERWRRRLITGVVIVVVLLIGLVIRLWPPTTLEDAIQHIKIEALTRPNGLGQSFKYGTGSNWYWVDASQRAELEKRSEDRDAIEVMLQTANGRPFLYHKFSTQAFINTPKGPVFVICNIRKGLNFLMRDAKSGLVLDLKPYKKTPEIAVVPLDVLAPYVTPRHSGDLILWKLHLVSEDNDTPSSDTVLLDPLAAIAFGSGQP